MPRESCLFGFRVINPASKKPAAILPQPARINVKIGCRYTAPTARNGVPKNTNQNCHHRRIRLEEFAVGRLVTVFVGSLMALAHQQGAARPNERELKTGNHERQSDSHEEAEQGASRADYSQKPAAIKRTNRDGGQREE